MSAMPEREVEARVEWFLTTGDVRQWSGPDEQNPFPLMQEDFAAYLASAESRLLAAEARAKAMERGRAERQGEVYEVLSLGKEPGAVMLYPDGREWEILRLGDKVRVTKVEEGQ